MSKKILRIIFIFIVSLNVLHASTTNYQYKYYSVHMPDGWDTIPKKELGLLNVDLGIYPIIQEDYFNGNYVLIGFIPTEKSLEKYTFKQIVSDIKRMNGQGEVENDTLKIHFNRMNFGNQENKHFIHSCFSVIMDTIPIEHCQTLCPTKFGYISILFYKKSNGVFSIDDANSQLSKIIQVEPNYLYIEPENKNISLVHIIISLCFGLFVYGLIVHLSRLKKPAK